MVRVARPDDLDALAAIAVEAFRDKYGPAFGPDALAGARAMMAVALAHPAARVLVAELDGRVAGAVQLLLGPGPDDEALCRAVQEAVGRRRTWRAVMVLGLLRPPVVAADLAYLDALGVASWARRRGVARALMEDCAARARAAGRRGVVLLVTADNTAALGLYERLGLRVVERRRWRVARAVFGSPGALVMEWSLPPG